ncbi:MAG: pyrroline-5-carboxylate reductase [Pseudomonadota bacterium]
MSKRNAVLLIGCGRMGSAIARTLATKHDVYAFDPLADVPPNVNRIDSLHSPSLPSALYVFLAVKPQSLESSASQLSDLAQPGRVFISILAGITLERLSEILGDEVPIIRAMPNTPVAIGHGITAATASRTLTQDETNDVSDMLELLGDFLWIDRERDLDIVTAMSGSGPAYFFRFAEALLRAGIVQGLPDFQAEKLIRQTFIGAARLCEAEALSFEKLREEVTSPGGTTEAGLTIMAENAIIDRLADKIVREAATRSRELAKAH